MINVVSQGLFLYQTALGAGAQIHVTHNWGCTETPYTNNLGLHVGDDPIAVHKRRSDLQAHLDKPLQWLNQTHGTQVYDCDTQGLTTDFAAPEADAAITQQTRIALAVMTADCLPIAFYASNNRQQHAVAAAHAGWRGLLAGVLDNTVAALQAKVPQASIHAHLGPCIGVSQFEVGGEVREVFLAQSPHHARHFTIKQTTASQGVTELDQYWCDLEGLARDALRRLGVTEISGGGWCTVSDPRLASYRRNRVTGRFATTVSLNR